MCEFRVGMPRDAWTPPHGLVAWLWSLYEDDDCYWLPCFLIVCSRCNIKKNLSNLKITLYIHTLTHIFTFNTHTHIFNNMDNSLGLISFFHLMMMMSWFCIRCPPHAAWCNKEAKVYMSRRSVEFRLSRIISRNTAFWYVITFPSIVDMTYQNLKIVFVLIEIYSYV